MTKEKLDRISALSRKQRSSGLTDEERAEQKMLRDEYRAGVIRNLTAQLDNIEIVDSPDNNISEVEDIEIIED
ncbi:MAG: DUF896 domain-containing protein [Oscillospiraceae bacterium]|nr:DUF896 domain-containing protein [Oscillospiraceae bacterium]MBQ8979268.1 DUF896 domain-containing protein [Oscillospiraceae bacterium]